MTQELFYTSAPKGLQPASRGFCTVAATRGMPAALMEKLEALSGYKPLYPPLDAKASLNPVVYTHLRISVGSKTYSLLSRIGPAGLDYSERANKFAHHVVLEPAEYPPAGPAWLLQQPGFMETQWDGQVRMFRVGRTPPSGNVAPAVCRAWQDLTGDAGWAGVLAESLQHDPNRLVYLVFEPGMQPLPVIAEALALLPPVERWDVTFSTYFTGLPQGAACIWRCVLKDSAEAKSARQFPNALILNLGPRLAQAQGGPLVAAARGQAYVPPAATEPEAAGYTAGAMERSSRGRQAQATSTRTARAGLFEDGNPEGERPSVPMPVPPPLTAAPAAPRRSSWVKSWPVGMAVGIMITLGALCLGVSGGLVQLGKKVGDALDQPKTSEAEIGAREPPKLLPNANNNAKKPLDQQMDEERRKLRFEKALADARHAAPLSWESSLREAQALARDTEQLRVQHVRTLKKVEDWVFDTRFCLEVLRLGRLTVRKHKPDLPAVPAINPEPSRKPSANKKTPSPPPEIVPYNLRLPSQGKGRTAELVVKDLPLEQSARFELSLPGLKEDFYADHKLATKEGKELLISVQKKQEDPEPLARLWLEGSTVHFEWKNDKPGHVYELARRYVRNSVLKLYDQSSKRSIFIGLIQQPMKEPPPFDLSASKPYLLPFDNRERKPIHELFVTSAGAELKSSGAKIESEVNRIQLAWDENITVRVEKSGEESALVVERKGSAKEASVVVVKSCVICMRVAGVNVEVLHLGR
jgi:hypothetical protein